MNPVEEVALVRGRCHPGSLFCAESQRKDERPASFAGEVRRTRLIIGPSSAWPVDQEGEGEDDQEEGQSGKVPAPPMGSGPDNLAPAHGLNADRLGIFGRRRSRNGRAA